MSVQTYSTPRCPYCLRSSLVELDPIKVKQWTQHGKHAQDVWPEKTADERELLITGTHPECWTKLFGEEE